MNQVIAAFDIDGTLIQKNSSFLLCQYLTDQGVFSKSDMYVSLGVYAAHVAGLCSLASMHEKLFKRLFKGRDVKYLQQYLPRFMETQIEPIWYKPAVDRLNELAESGVRIVLCSSSPSLILQPIAERLGVNTLFATEYHINDEGNLCSLDRLVDGQKKADFLLSLEASHTLAFSDSILDLPFLEVAETAVAVCPSRKLKRVAVKKGWEIL